MNYIINELNDMIAGKVKGGPVVNSSTKVERVEERLGLTIS